MDKKHMEEIEATLEALETIPDNPQISDAVRAQSPEVFNAYVSGHCNGASLVLSHVRIPIRVLLAEVRQLERENKLLKQMIEE